MCERENAIVGLIGMVERGELWNRKGSPRDRRKTAEGSLTFELKISKLPNHINRTRNALVFRGYVIATKKAQRTHEEWTRKGKRRGPAGLAAESLLLWHLAITHFKARSRQAASLLPSTGCLLLISMPAISSLGENNAMLLFIVTP